MKKRSAGLILISGKKILVLRRARSCRNPGKWGLPGGQRDRGETARSAAMREAMEEMGGVPPHEQLGQLVFRRGHKEYRVLVLRTAKSVRRKWAPKLNAEHDDYRWVDVSWCLRHIKRLHPVMRLAFECQASHREIKRVVTGSKALRPHKRGRTRQGRVATRAA